VCSRADRNAAILAIVFMALSAGSASARQQTDPSAAERPGPAEIKRALEIVKADPNLGAKRTIKTLRWNDQTPPKPRKTPAWLAWIAGFFRWLDQSARLLLYVALGVLAGMLVVYITRVVRRYRSTTQEEPFTAPTHVRSLDIRPASLPDDIGAAARQLWDGGEHRAALALLYRGMLSRLAHVHRVPIRDSSTEGDCLALASSHLAESKRKYTLDLVTVWERFVYGGQTAQSATVYGLCDAFAASLDRTSTAEATADGGPS
jgi:hypothetical protein